MGQQIVDWTVIDDERVVTACEYAAKAVARQYDGVMEYADLMQEAYIAVATSPGLVRGYVANGEGGYLNRWVWQRLTDIVRKENQDYHKHVESLDAVR